MTLLRTIASVGSFVTTTPACGAFFGTVYGLAQRLANPNIVASDIPQIPLKDALWNNFGSSLQTLQNKVIVGYQYLFTDGPLQDLTSTGLTFLSTPLKYVPGAIGTFTVITCVAMNRMAGAPNIGGSTKAQRMMAVAAAVGLAVLPSLIEASGCAPTWLEFGDLALAITQGMALYYGAKAAALYGHKKVSLLLKLGAGMSINIVSSAYFSQQAYGYRTSLDTLHNMLVGCTAVATILLSTKCITWISSMLPARQAPPLVDNPPPEEDDEEGLNLRPPEEDNQPKPPRVYQLPNIRNLVQHYSDEEDEEDEAPRNVIRVITEHHDAMWQAPNNNNNNDVRVDEAEQPEEVLGPPNVNLEENVANLDEGIPEEVLVVENRPPPVIENIIIPAPPTQKQLDTLFAKTTLEAAKNYLILFPKQKRELSHWTFAASENSKNAATELLGLWSACWKGFKAHLVHHYENDMVALVNALRDQSSANERKADSNKQNAYYAHMALRNFLKDYHLLRRTYAQDDTFFELDFRQRDDLVFYEDVNSKEYGWRSVYNTFINENQDILNLLRNEKNAPYCKADMDKNFVPADSDTKVNPLP